MADAGRRRLRTARARDVQARRRASASGARLDVVAHGARDRATDVAPRARLAEALQRDRRGRGVGAARGAALRRRRLLARAGRAAGLAGSGRRPIWSRSTSRLDTGSAAGRRTVAALREVERWERAPPAGRPPRGRPGLAARAPELSARIAAMRERGHSLQAIADALNADGVPTQRGGARWRPSSVQAALGYRRPRPPPRPAAPAPPRPRAPASAAGRPPRTAPGRRARAARRAAARRARPRDRRDRAASARSACSC